ncbi:MAG: hypothetical protein ACREBW_00715 [Candidatus Micrarchaeaceae archaeon]
MAFAFRFLAAGSPGFACPFLTLFRAHRLSRHFAANGASKLSVLGSLFAEVFYPSDHEYAIAMEQTAEKFKAQNPPAALWLCGLLLSVNG